MSIIIIGAGLSGLYTAWRLRQKQINDIVILDARPRTGGRILSTEYHGSHFDMGPAWVWPGMQLRLSALASELGISIFKQFTDGDMLYENSDAVIERYSGQSSHQQSYRIANGAGSLISALTSTLDKSSLYLNTRVQAIHEHNMRINAAEDGQPTSYTADQVILALPPRVLQQSIAFHPPLSKNITNTFEHTPTWMAGHCKIIFIYTRPFWREQGLSGEIFSHRGPLSEIYDASTMDEKHYALSAFVGLNAQQRSQYDEQRLIDASIEQLVRLFGESSKEVVKVIVKDWSIDQFTASNSDLNSPMQHPQYPADTDRHCWDKKVIIAGTETAAQHGGYLEGALESAEAAISLIKGA